MRWPEVNGASGFAEEGMKGWKRGNERRREGLGCLKHIRLLQTNYDR